MGVNTLLKQLAPCLEDSHVERFRGKTVAIDGNTFIFRGCYSCSEQVALGVPCRGPVDHLLKRVHMLKHYGVKPWVVLDGRRTPMKDDTSKHRRQEREKNLGFAKEFRRQADDASGAERDALLQKAQSFFQKSIRVTRQMVTNAMDALKKEGVECMVAPYEADAQVAFLVKCGLASAVITEDSDILVYMAAVKSTASVLYKIDEYGRCKELGFDPQRLSSLPGEIGKFGRGLSTFAGAGGGRSFVQLAALAGCDYIDNVKGVGLLSALPIITKFQCIPADKRVSRILMHLQKMGKTVPEGHRERMRLAEMSFFWHRVYDPRSRTCVHFCDAAPELIGTADVPALPSTAGGAAFLGEPIEDGLMVKISRGKVDPVTGDPVTPETIPAPGNGDGGGGRRSVTHQPSRSGDRGRSTAHSKSATMPATTPSGTRNQQGQHRQQQQQRQQQPPGRNSRGGGHKQCQEWRGRAGQTTHPGREHGGGGGLLKDMFERARCRAEDKKENLPPNEPDTAVLQDVSEIVLACGSGETPARCARDPSSRASATAAAAVPNPFAKKPKGTAANPSPSDFRTPSAITVVGGSGGGVRLTGGAAPLAGYAGGDSDAWSRLSKGCLAAGVRDGEEACDTAREGGSAVPRDDLATSVVTPMGGDSEAVSEASGTVSAAAESAGVKPVAPKRSLSAPPSRGGCAGGGRGKKKAKLGGGGGRKSQSHPPPAGKGATMLSFFGRAAGSKP